LWYFKDNVVFPDELRSNRSAGDSVGQPMLVFRSRFDGLDCVAKSRNWGTAEPPKVDYDTKGTAAMMNQKPELQYVVVENRVKIVLIKTQTIFSLYNER
jgi:hypothetical protein